MHNLGILFVGCAKSSHNCWYVFSCLENLFILRFLLLLLWVAGSSWPGRTLYSGCCCSWRADLSKACSYTAGAFLSFLLLKWCCDCPFGLVKMLKSVLKFCKYSCLNSPVACCSSQFWLLRYITSASLFNWRLHPLFCYLWPNFILFYIVSLFWHNLFSILCNFCFLHCFVKPVQEKLKYNQDLLHKRYSKGGFSSGALIMFIFILEKLPSKVWSKTCKDGICLEKRKSKVRCFKGTGTDLIHFYLYILFP